MRFSVHLMILLTLSSVTGIVNCQPLTNSSLLYPWAGGMNSCQFGSIDINLDGKNDIVVFDRFGARLLPFINEGSYGEVSYSYHPEYTSLFPELKEWVIFADYNCDGKPDIFTYFNGGVRVYKNVSDTSLKFELVTNQLSSYYYSGKTGIFLTNVDYPAIADIDGDGDLDFLTFFGLGSYIEYHRNYSIENNGTCDSLDFRLEDKCWGDIKESEGGNRLTLNIICPYKYSGLQGLSCNGTPPKHTGSTILATDLNGDGVKDVIIGDIDFPNLISLINGGTRDSAHMVSQDSIFPDNIPVQLYSLPSCSFIDVDNDGVRDLIISPFDPQYYISENKHSNWYYKNTGSDSSPVFQLITTSFLQNQMIDVGTSASPVLTDINGDGLPDLLVGNYGYFDSAYNDKGILHSVFTSGISYFRNTGTAGNPLFTLITDNFANLASLHQQGIFPSFYDMDADGDIDMITGNSDGNLLYFNNKAGPGKEPVFDSPVMNYMNISAGKFSAPQIFDLDKDGLPDLLIGNQKGTIFFYRNTGSLKFPAFTMVTDSLGRVDVTNHNQDYYGNSTPCFFRDESGSTGLVVGSKEGKVHYYTNIDGNLSGTFTLSDSLLSSICGVDLPASFGITSSAAIGKLRNSGSEDLIVGNFSGGLNYYPGKPAPTVFTGLESNPHIEKSAWSVFPNPTQGRLFIRLSNKGFSGKSELTLFDSLGEILLKKPVSSPDLTSIDISNFPDGFYYINIIPSTTDSFSAFSISKLILIH